MAIGGGGGGGILGFSNSFTGTASAIEIAGDFAYAYSGGVPLNNETKTALEFQTGNYLFVSQTQLTGRTAGMAANKELGLIISLNDTEVLRQQPMTNNAQGFNDLDPFDIIIPPYTQVKVQIYSNDTGDIDFFVTMTGRIYRN